MPSPTFLDLAASIDPVLNRNINFPRRQVGSGATALTNLDCLVDVDASGGAAIVTLPDSATVKRGMLFEIKKIDASANTVTVNAFGGQTIDGSPAQVLVSQWRNIVVYSDGTNYKIYAASLTTPVGTDTGLALTSTGITYTGGVEGFGAIADVTGVTFNFNLAIAATVQFFCSGASLANPFIQGNYLGLAINVNGTDHYINGTGEQGFNAVGGGNLVVSGFTSGDAISGHLALDLPAGPYTVTLRAFGNGYLESSALFPTKLTAVYPLVTGPVAGAAALLSQESGPFSGTVNPAGTEYHVVGGSSLSVILLTSQTIVMSAYTQFVDSGTNSCPGQLSIRLTSPGPVVTDFEGSQTTGGNDVNKAASTITRAVALAAGTHTFELIVRNPQSGAQFEYEDAWLTLVYNDPVAIASTPEAATLVVHPTAGEGDYQTIDAALSNLPAEGGYILVREGTYSLTTTLTMPDKPVVIRGCGDATIIDLGTNAIAAFTAGFARKYTLEDIRVTGSTDVNRRVVTVSAGATFQMNRVVAVSMRQIAEVTGGAAAMLDFNFCKFQSLLNNAASWFVNANANTFVRAVATSVEGTSNAGGINGGPAVDLTDCTIPSVNGVSVGDDSTLTGVTFNGTAGETVTLGDRTKVANCIFFQVMVDAAGNEVHITTSQFEGTAAQNRLLDVTAGATGPEVTACTFKGGDTDHIGIATIDTVIEGCVFFDNGSLVRSIDISLAASRAIIVGNNFQFQTEAIRTDSTGAVISNNLGCLVLETANANNNDYSENTGFSGSTIVGAGSTVNGSKKADAAASTTNALVTIVSTIVNPKGMLGIGTVKNTDGANSLDVKESFTDAFGTTSTLTTTVTPGNYLPLDLGIAIGTGLPPYVSYKVEIIDTVAGNHATYVSHFTSQGAAS